MSLFTEVGRTLTTLIRPTALPANDTTRPAPPRPGSPTAPPPRPGGGGEVPTVSANVALVRAFANVIMYYEDTTTYGDQAIQVASYVKRPTTLPNVSRRGSVPPAPAAP